MTKYKIIEKNDVPELAVIEVSGFKNEITLGDTLQSIRQNNKGILELEGELRIKRALIQNITTNHPEVKDISEETQIAVHMFYEASRFIKIAEEKLGEFKKAQEGLEEEVKQIELQTGLKTTSVEKNTELVKEIKKQIKKKNK